MKSILILILTLNCLCLTGAPGDDAKAKSELQEKGFKDIGMEEFDKLRQHKGNVVLDVRTPKEFKAGHLPGAINVDWNSPDFSNQVAALDRNKTYLVHCAVGGRSAKASDKLSKLGFQSIYNLPGGIKAWEKAGKPVEKE